MASCPYRVAHHSGVRPRSSLHSTSAPFSSSSLTMASCLFRTAHNSGVRPSSSSHSAPFSSSSLTMAACSFRAAHDSGVRPYCLSPRSRRPFREALLILTCCCLNKAARSLSRLRRLPAESPAIQNELGEILANHEFELSLGKSSYLDCFRGPMLKRQLTGCGVQAMQQLSGINFIFYYGTQFCFLAIAFVYFFIYETKTLSLEEVDELYNEVSSARKSAGWRLSTTFLQRQGTATQGVIGGSDDKTDTEHHDYKHSNEKDSV
ncbi:high-affinity glucose transporter RGT2 [Ilyonectria robusta]